MFLHEKHCVYDVVIPNFRDDTFADVHNLDHCIKYLNQSLVTFGFPSGLNLYSSEPVSAVIPYFNFHECSFRFWSPEMNRPRLWSLQYLFWSSVQMMVCYRVQLYEHVTASMPWFSSGNGTLSIVKQLTRPDKGASTSCSQVNKFLSCWRYNQSLGRPPSVLQTFGCLNMKSINCWLQLKI